MSIGGNYYALVTVDDYSRYTWTLFLSSKSIASKAFQKLAKLIQKAKCKIGPPLYLHLRIWSPYNLIHKFGPQFYKSLQN